MSFCEQAASAVQFRLSNLGYYRLRVDGIPGPGQDDAISRFKAAHGLAARPFVGPLTLTALFSPNAKPWVAPPASEDEPGWLTEARGLLGTREAPGKANNPVIMGWARDLDQWYPGDDVPWCGLFVAHCMSVGAPREPQNFNRLGARAWLEYGVEAETDLPPLGGVAVFWRTHLTRSWHGHVAIVNGYSADAIRCIGGNQSDNVTEAWFPRGRLLGIRVPTGAILPPAPKAATGKLSTNEA